MVTLVLLIVLLIITSSSGSFVWFMNQQQLRAGERHRSQAALAIAEAGIQRALSVLETVTPDGQSAGRHWRPEGHSETLHVGPLAGRFILSLKDGPGAAIIVDSVGEVAGAMRRIRARVNLASPALLAALYAVSVIRLDDPPAATLVIPYGAGVPDQPWTHIAVGQGIWFASTDVSLNNPSLPFHLNSGPVDAPVGVVHSMRLHRSNLARILLGRGADLNVGLNRQRVDIQQLRAMGLPVEQVVHRRDTLPKPPTIDRDSYRAKAAVNTANAGLNEAAGKYVGDIDLAYKSDSLYSRVQFEQLQTYLKAGFQPPRLKGLIYITGGLALLEGQRLEIVDGALITEGTVHISQAASLEILHSAATRALPGLIVLDNGALAITAMARLRVHGLVYVNKVFSASGDARVEIVGSVLGNDGDLSFRNSAATIMIRYDPAVLGTPGLRVPSDSPVVAWVASWEELP